MKYLSKINPVFKLILSALMFIYSMINNSIYPLVIYLGIVLLAMIMDGLYERVISGIIPAIILFLPITSINYLFGSSLEFSLVCGIRILYIFVAFILFDSTTSLSDFTRSLHKFNFPLLLNIGLTITIRFIPILKNEIKKINDSFNVRMKNKKTSINIRYIATIVPTVFKIINISDDLTMALNMRAFGIGNYSSYKEIKIHTMDYLFIIINLILMVVLIWIF